jgi:hypothetical protein
VTTDDLAAALYACADGLYPLEAGTGLLISNGTFLHRDDFTGKFITRGTSDGNPMAAIDWHSAITALANGSLPCSGGERRILQLSASLAAGTPVSLCDTVSGLDHDNTTRLLIAIRHATGKRPENSQYENHLFPGKSTLWRQLRNLSFDRPQKFSRRFN